jgi:hypothetical protein
VAAPAEVKQRACTDRTFELPPVIHLAMAALFLGFVTVLCAAFATPGLLIPYAVFGFFIIAYFAVPSLWALMKPEENLSHSLSWSEFMEKGVDTASGHESGREAAVLVLMLPAFIFCWAVAIAIISEATR